MTDKAGGSLHSARANALARKLTPEERELEAKRAILRALEIDLAQQELNLATLQGALRAFEASYYRAVGPLYRELDEIEAQTAEAFARQRPNDSALRGRAAAARAKACETAEATAVALASKNRPDFTPTDDLKSLYREVAKRVHPDLATDEANRVRRTNLMAEANEAYAQGDIDRLRAILDRWESSPENVDGVGVAAELIRTIRKIHQVEQRLAAIATQLEALTLSKLHQLSVSMKRMRLDETC